MHVVANALVAFLGISSRIRLLTIEIVTHVNNNLYEKRNVTLSKGYKLTSRFDCIKKLKEFIVCDLNIMHQFPKLFNTI